MTNAAKHAGAGRVDVYAEVSPTAVDVFVRDRGRGFDPGSTPADRHGVRHSIVDRMDRHGGSAEVRSTVGEGTEVRLHLPREARDPAGHDRRTWMSEHAAVSVVVVDDHAMFRRGVRAELEATGAGVVDVRAEAADVDEAVAAITAAPARRRTARRAPARRRRGRGDAPASAAPASLAADPVPRFLALSGLRRRRGRDRHDPRRRPRLRHQDHHRARAGAGDPPGGRRATRSSPRGWPASCSTPSPAPIDVAAVDEDLDRLTEREREVMRLHRPRLRLQGGRQGAVHLDQDRGDARVQRAAEAAAVLPARADPVGQRPPPALTGLGGDGTAGPLTRPGGVRRLGGAGEGAGPWRGI